jgi:hypothetical protein
VSRRWNLKGAGTRERIPGPLHGVSHATPRAFASAIVAVFLAAPALVQAGNVEAGAVETTSIPTPVTSTSRWSEKRLFEVSYTATPSPVPLLTTHAWTVTIADGEGRPVRDASLAVLGGMPEHDHGFPTTPQVRPLGDGRYLVEGIKFHMPGDWVVILRIQAGANSDSVRFELHL